MDSSQQTQQTPQQSEPLPQTPQPLIGQQVSPIVTSIDVPQTDANSANDSSATSGVSVSLSANVMPLPVNVMSETQNCSTSAPNLSVNSSPIPSVVVSTAMAAQVSHQTPSTQSQQLIVSSSQPQLVSSTQSTQMHANSALMAQTLGATITSMANHTVQMAAHQSPQANQMQSMLQTPVQATTANQMSVAMSSIPQVQVIQQPIGSHGGTYQFQPVYPQQMLLPGNLTIQNMQFGAHNQGLSLQIPFTGANVSNVSTMPITSIASKTPIMSKGVAISPLNQSQHHMLSHLKQNVGHQSTQQILKHVLPAQQFMPHSTGNQTVVISQLLPHQTQQLQQSILPANANKTIMEAPKGKPFGTGSVRSAFGNKMLSHSGAIQPKSPILPATSISSSFVTNSQFKSPFSGNQNTTQLIATQSPSNLINQQILGSFQTLPPGLTWATGPQQTHLVAPNGSPIFIRGPTQTGEHMFISTSNMSSPQIQTVSMATPINVHNSGATMQVNTGQTQSNVMTPTTLQSISTVSNANFTATTTAVNTSQPTAIAPAPIAPSVSKSRTVRQASSVATQTAAPANAQKAHVESTSTLKPIAPAKPKASPQPIIQNTKPVNKESNQTAVRSMSVGITQTNSQPTPPSNKSDAANQTVKKSVATETIPSNIKPNNQVSSSRVSENKATKTNSSTNTSSESSTQVSQQKVNSASEEVKTPIKKPSVEKKDASTEQDSDLSPTPFAQNSYKSAQNAIQTASTPSNTTSQTNGTQIAVLSDLNRQDISKQPQKAIVKPQILTHVIDGYIIQESPNPFPVNGIPYNCDSKSLNDEKNNPIVIPMESIKSKNKNENSLNSSPSSSRNRSTSDRQLCLNCNTRRKSNSKNNRNSKAKRFCSHLCSEEYEKNSATSPRLGLYNAVTATLDSNDVQKRHEVVVELSQNDTEKQTIDEKKKTKSLKRSHESNDFINSTKNGDINVANDRNQRKPITSEIISEKVTPSVPSISPNGNITDESGSSAIAGLYIPPGGRNPLQWTVNDVYEFVRNLQGCTEYADEFRSQEIDGQALMLIKEDHLMNTMNMKLGPALKICNKINALREDVQKTT